MTTVFKLNSTACFGLRGGKGHRYLALEKDSVINNQREREGPAAKYEVDSRPI